MDVHARGRATSCRMASIFGQLPISVNRHSGPVTERDRGEGAVDLPGDLRGLTAFVQIPMRVWSGPDRSSALLRHRLSLSAADRGQSPAAPCLVVAQELSRVRCGRGGDQNRQSPQGSQGTDVELAAVGVLRLEVFPGFDLLFPLREDLVEPGDDLTEFLAGEVPAKPEKEACCLGHGGAFPAYCEKPFDYLRIAKGGAPPPSHIAFQRGSCRPTRPTGGHGGQQPVTSSHSDFGRNGGQT
jgi:hypothetical protein